MGKFKELTSDDPEFMMNDGVMLCPRAAVVITDDCPDMYQQILVQAFQKKWVKPIAYVPNEEVFMQTLSGVYVTKK